MTTTHPLPKPTDFDQPNDALRVWLELADDDELHAAAERYAKRVA